MIKGMGRMQVLLPEETSKKAIQIAKDRYSNNWSMTLRKLIEIGIRVVEDEQNRLEANKFLSSDFKHSQDVCVHEFNELTPAAYPSSATKAICKKCGFESYTYPNKK